MATTKYAKQKVYLSIRHEDIEILDRCRVRARRSSLTEWIQEDLVRPAILAELSRDDTPPITSGRE